MPDVFIHPTALVETADIGPGTKIWAFAHVMAGAVIGADCNLGDHVFVESGARIGRGVTIKNQVLIWSGVEIADYVFVGPNVVFTNDRYPRSPRMPEVKWRYAQPENWLVRTTIEQGASIGAQATILCGLRLGAYCAVAAGSVVTRDVPPHRLVAGNPARPRGYVDREGAVLHLKDGCWWNPAETKRYEVVADTLRECPL
jgi:acetyltransferase-like isoleucine patch superfamily enzyme